ncbi:MAG: hypothetical protein NT159_22285 [Proteobacteria bacterium]|nr:hypothetical protein [Pseudomonadota bacterium]
MPARNYDEVLDLFRKGAVAEAEEQFNALHEDALARQSSPRREHADASKTEPGEEGQPVSDGSAYYRVVNGKKHGPYCRHCYDTESRLEKLRLLNVATYICSSCKRECARNLCG